MDISLLTHRFKPVDTANCHTALRQETTGLPLVAIVGSPNVGKSVLFNTLTGAYVTVSNYPGTTVEVARGKGGLDHRQIGVVDTPGMYRLLPITEEERVAREILLVEEPAVVIHVVDAKNLERMLPMTLQLVEARLPVILDLNLMDEAERLGVHIDAASLACALDLPVVETALALGRGVEELRRLLGSRLEAASKCSAPSARPSRSASARDFAPLRGEGDRESGKVGWGFAPPHWGGVGEGCQGTLRTPGMDVVGDCTACCPQGEAAIFSSPIQYHPVIESALLQIEHKLEETYQISRRALGILLLQNDREVLELVRSREAKAAEEVAQIARDTQSHFSQPLSYLIARDQQRAAHKLIASVLHFSGRPASDFASRLSAAMINPATGLPILAAALLLLYGFVGVLGAQTLVSFLENTVFGTYINPVIDTALNALVPWQIVRDLIGGQYGILTLGLRYAVAIILPIVGTFFIAFSIIEDSGYLPRLALLIDRVFKHIGLNGRAVIPLVLGFGCDTMATIVTRTLETRRERLLSTILLSLAIPCSAQLGVMLALLAGRPDLLFAWGGIVLALLLLVGFLAARVVPGERPAFYMELPPLRMPTLRNIFVKTYTRMEWYLREVLPMFVIASVVIWFGRLTGLFDLALTGLKPLVSVLGLPPQTAVAFLFGFFRRDYGAAGLYDLHSTLTGEQLLVATVTMTIFVPCIAQFSVTAKERGWKTAIAIAAFIFPFAFVVGFVLNQALLWLGVR